MSIVIFIQLDCNNESNCLLVEANIPKFLASPFYQEILKIFKPVAFIAQPAVDQFFSHFFGIIPPPFFV